MDYLGTTFLHGPLLSKQYDEYVLQGHEFWAILARLNQKQLCRELRHLWIETTVTKGLLLDSVSKVGFSCLA